MTSPSVLSYFAWSILRFVVVVFICFNFGCAKKPRAPSSDAPESAPGAGSKATTSPGNDATALVGTWQVSSIDPGDPQLFPREQLDTLKKLTGTVKGDRLTTTRPDGKPMTFMIQVDQTKNPRTLDLFPLDESGRTVTETVGSTGPKGATQRENTVSFKLIYRLDGDTLTVACADDSSRYRPTVLKAAAEQDCLRYDGTKYDGDMGKSAVATAVLKRVK